MGNLIRKQGKYSGKSLAGNGGTGDTGEPAPAPPVHGGAILGLACLTEETVVTCSDDKTIGIYDRSTHTASMYLRGHTKAVNRVLAHGSHIWSCSRDLSVRLWDSKSAECLRTIEDAHTLNVAAISYSPATNQLASGSRDYHVKTWDVETGAVRNEYTAPRNIVTCMQYDSTGNMLYQGSEDLCIRVWDTRSRNSQPAIHITGYVYFPLSLSICPTDGGNYVATGCKGFNSVGCTVRVFDIRSLKHSLVADMAGHAHDVSACQFISQSRVLTASKDGTIRIWDPQQGFEIGQYTSDMDLQYTSIGYYRDDNCADRINNKFFVSSFSGVLGEFSIYGLNNTKDSISIENNYMTGPAGPSGP